MIADGHNVATVQVNHSGDKVWSVLDDDEVASLGHEWMGVLDEAMLLRAIGGGVGHGGAACDRLDEREGRGFVRVFVTEVVGDIFAGDGEDGIRCIETAVPGAPCKLRIGVVLQKGRERLRRTIQIQ